MKNLPAMQKTQEMRVRFLGQEDPLEEGMALTPVSLPGESHGQRSLGATVHRVAELDMTEATEPAQARVRTHRFCSVPAVLDLQRLRHRVRLFMW